MCNISLHIIICLISISLIDSINIIISMTTSSSSCHTPSRPRFLCLTLCPSLVVGRSVRRVVDKNTFTRQANVKHTYYIQIHHTTVRIIERMRSIASYIRTCKYIRDTYLRLYLRAMLEQRVDDFFFLISLVREKKLFI